MRSLNTLFRCTLLVLVALMVTRVDAQEESEVTDADIPTAAATFYVRISGNDANSGTNPGQAYRTIRRAASMAPAGSVIYVGAGTYTSNIGFLNLKSTSSQPLYVIADVNGTRTGDSGAVILGPGARMAFSGCNHVRVTGFTFQGPTSRCFEWRASTQGIVQNCTFIGGTNGVKIRSGEIKFQDCTVKDFTTNGIDVYGTAELFMMNCTIQNCGSAGLRMNRYGRVTVETSNLLDNVGDGLAVDSITSTDDGMIGTPPSQLLLDALNLLIAARPSATKKGQDKIDDAIDKLNEALLPKYWQDPWHPHSKVTADIAKSNGIDAKEGKDVFKLTGDALDKLKDFMKNDAGKDAELGNFATVKSNVTQATLLAVEASRLMALLALEEAMFAGADSKEIEKFQKDYKKADKEIDKGHYHHAADKYGKAWEDAAKAADNWYAVPPPASVDNDNPADADAKKFLTISSSKFKKNAYGLRCVTPQKLAMRFSELSDNTQSGLYLTGDGRVEDCTIAGNGQGVYLKDTKDLNQFKRLKITNNTQHGLYAEKCNLAFTSTNIADLKISGSQYVIAGKESDISFESLTISGGITAGVQLLQGNAKAYKVNFTGNGTGLNLEDGNFALYDCTLSGNTVGLQAVKCTSLSVKGSQIRDNTDWGVKLGGRGSFSDTTVSGNGIGGFELSKLTGSDISLARMTLTDNVTYGFYCNESTMTFDASKLNDVAVTGSEIVFAGYLSSLTFDGVPISGGSTYGIANYSGTVAVNKCTLSGNGIGLYSDNGCSATNSTFTANTTTGASVLGAATFTNCLFEKNSSGLQISNDTTGSVKLFGSQIKDNTLYGVWCDACTLTFNAAMQADWTVQKNGSNFGATGSTLTFDGFTISEGKTYGIVSEMGTLNLNNSKLTTNGTGVYVDANSTLVANDTKFTGNSSYGVHLQGAGSLHNCSVTGNANGLYLNAINVTDANLTGTNISGNTSYGVYSHQGSLALTSQSSEGWSINSNGYNIASYQADVTLTGATLTDATSFGVYAQYGNVNVLQSTITSKSGGLWGLYTTAFNVDRSKISGTSTGSWGVANVDGGLTMRNTIVSGSQYGVYSSDTVPKPVTIYNTTIADASQYGLYVNSGDVTVMNTIISGTNGTSGLYVGASANVAHSHNLVSGFATAFENTTADATEVLDLPHFTDAANGDYSLGKASPAINAGTDLSASHTIDMLGNARPSHKVFEIGAYEYMQDAGSFRVLDWKEKR